MARVDPFDRPDVVAAASGGEEAVYRRRARRLGLSYTPHVVLGPNAYSDLSGIERGTFAMDAGEEGSAYLAPSEEIMPAIGHWLARHPTVRRRLAVATPTAIRAALRRAGEDGYASLALNRLERVDPRFSARRTVTRRQAVIGGAAMMAILAAMLVSPSTTIFLVDLVAAFFFLGVSMLRFAAAGRVPLRASPAVAPADETILPVYTILVPLLHEAHIVRQIVAAFDRIDWPRDRLDIKLVVEEDDAATRFAATHAAPGTPYEIVIVPDGAGPRTKPMALQYALTFARGDFVAIYDAEDLPHPGQLREAFETFRRNDDRLACLQAPIVIDNARKNLITRLFAIEYSTVFDGILPALAELRLPLPLGGTSNHFRRSAIEHVGGWDPFNVTEDADLGIRFARFGYRVATILLPTGEEAPAAFGPWLRQRSRWFKGWLQTWLVCLRQPLRFSREIGFRQTCGFMLVGMGMIVSAVAHPLFLATPILVAGDPLSMWNGDPLVAAIVGLNLFNLIAGYVAIAVLARRTLALRRRGWAMTGVVWLPFYWLLMAIACVRAVIQLATRPHHWEKTPHVGRRQARPEGQPRFAASRQRS